MARLSYAAPGVYVEEVPSTRQPIAGVGTNTVGFIGIVPDVIYCPVANPGYDPVTARRMFELSRASAGQGDDRLEELKRQVEPLANDLKSLREVDLAKKNADVATRTTELNTAKTERDNLAPDADAATRRPADRKLADAQRNLDTATAARDEVQEQIDKKEGLRKSLEDAIAAAGAAPAPAVPRVEFPSEEDAYGDVGDVAEDLLRPSVTKPYYLKRVTVPTPEFATRLCTNFTEYVDRFGDFSAFGDRDVTDKDGKKIGTNSGPMHPGHHLLTHAVAGFFRNGGTRCFVARITGPERLRDALTRFESIDEVAILAAPGLPKTKAVWGELQDYCEDAAHQNVFAILDSPARVEDDQGTLDVQKLQYDDPANSLLPRMSNHAAFYFPHIEVKCPAKSLQDEDPARDVPPKYRGLTYVAPSGHMAGVYARIDEERGVHKAPANAVVRGALEVKYYVSKAKQESLNPQGVNCIRLMNGTVTVWGARTIGGQRNGEWMYINVRRFAGFLEESIDEGTQWVVFEPNDPALWSKIRLNITAFLTNVWRNGALVGLTPEEAFYVKCDAELNPPEVRDLGQVVTEIGVAIVRPAEFVIFRISQSTGIRQA